MQPHPTLDQLQVFLTVVEKGSFSAASRALNRTQSVVSYTIANLEAQLRVALFSRSGTKRPQLTEAGRSVLEDARRLLGDLDLMRARVQALSDGLEAELNVAMSAIVPTDIVVDVLRAFRSHYPTVSLNVTVGTLGIVIDAVSNARAVVGFGGAMATRNDQIVFERIGQSAMIPVAAPDHPLAKLRRPMTLADVRDETQLVVYDASGLTKGRDFNVFSLKTWRVSDNATKHLYIRGALGWGGLPASLVRDDLADGRLVHLQFPIFDQGEYPIHVIRNVANPPGPAARWLTTELQARLSATDKDGGDQKGVH
ncbi:MULTISPECIES: LysR family transcriptional regulator [unclassified Rhizobium]|jgi:DNA-binding transcriptional LysR family regulator|uniref:LysR family transcriptional regulator n=1 Tax=unclassified Rhizobium TaxID=2613769 RepID=UPI001C83D2F1|nr:MULTISPECIES: LysR family transcriptional regulator [unclassified Rhizobium]MBX5160703.1 LysR family transcriptional regulator [Rhizobium sp. NZLR8]MBX5167624.1 LysR family transcriptional regulator [Rhizobium sp. NZLR4b]MBX5173156.1 LysR family transcriptional regulator [Rhizobium sp. NZLR1b]MBX5191842.1 LysR family transcriptional regulator [Rhizobium sp. NZLR3b]MBX5199388.1 LysR family transcriptional regulator [Rhizobium sp. NZLR10]